MPPLINDRKQEAEGRLFGYEDVPDLEPVEVSKVIDAKKEYKQVIVWRNVILMSLLHVSSLYGIYLIFNGAMIWTTLCSKFFLNISQHKTNLFNVFS